MLELGSARHDLSMLGGHPCITPPMWTTMATGCYANVHGITDYYRNVPEGHDHHLIFYQTFQSLWYYFYAKAFEQFVI